MFTGATQNVVWWLFLLFRERERESKKKTLSFRIKILPWVIEDVSSVTQPSQAQAFLPISGISPPPFQKGIRKRFQKTEKNFFVEGLDRMICFRFEHMYGTVTPRDQ